MSSKKEKKEKKRKKRSPLVQTKSMGKKSQHVVSNRERKKKMKNEANMWEMGDLEVNFKVRGIFEPHFMNFSLLIFFQFGKKIFW